jgi:hypothetical protein
MVDNTNTIDYKDSINRNRSSRISLPLMNHLWFHIYHGIRRIPGYLYEWVCFILLVFRGPPRTDWVETEVSQSAGEKSAYTTMVRFLTEAQPQEFLPEYMWPSTGYLIRTKLDMSLEN